MFTYEAYAPRPIVLEIILKGRSLGSGSSCDCDMFSYEARFLDKSTLVWNGEIQTPKCAWLN